MPPECACSRHAEVQTTHESHGSPSHRLEDVPEKLLQDIMQMVEIDTVIYLHALDRFYAEATHAANVTGIPVLCDGDVQRLWETAKSRQTGTSKGNGKEPASRNLQAAVSAGLAWPRLTGLS